VAFDAIVINHHDFAILDFTNELRADDVQRAGLGTQDVRITELAQDQWADAERIAGADQLLVGECHEGVGAFEAAERIDVALDQFSAWRARDEVQHDLGVGCRLADGALRDQLFPQGQAIREIAVMRDSKAACCEFRKERLHIAQDGFPGR
jgi:hypothetical protein